MCETIRRGIVVGWQTIVAVHDGLVPGRAAAEVMRVVRLVAPTGIEDALQIAVLVRKTTGQSQRKLLCLCRGGREQCGNKDPRTSRNDAHVRPPLNEGP